MTDSSNVGRLHIVTDKPLMPGESPPNHPLKVQGRGSDLNAARGIARGVVWGALVWLVVLMLGAAAAWGFPDEKSDQEMSRVSSGKQKVYGDSPSESVPESVAKSDREAELEERARGWFAGPHEITNTDRAYFIAAGMDLASTFLALDQCRNVSEANPIIQAMDVEDATPTILIGTLMKWGIWRMAKRLPEHEERVVLGWWTGGQIMAATWNTSVWLDCEKK